MARLLVMSVNHASGTSKKTGKTFDFTTLTGYKGRVENSADFRGLKSLEFFIDNSLFSKVPELPAICDVEYDLEPGFNGQAKMVVTDVKFVKKIDLGI